MCIRDRSRGGIEGGALEGGGSLTPGGVSESGGGACGVTPPSSAASSAASPARRNKPRAATISSHNRRPSVNTAIAQLKTSHYSSKGIALDAYEGFEPGGGGGSSGGSPAKPVARRTRAATMSHAS